MIEIIIIISVVVITFYFVSKPRTSVPLHEQIKDPLESLVKPEVIEDSSFLKSELAVTQEKLAKLNQELGRLSSLYNRTEDILRERNNQFTELSQKFDKLQHQKKSSEVKTGFLAESLLPLTSQFPCDPKTMRFLGSPVDFVSFDYDKMEITFVECKTGISQLNDNQRKVKKMVNDGKVKFVEVRLDENGIKVK